MSTRKDTYSNPICNTGVQNYDPPRLVDRWLTTKVIREELNSLIECGPDPLIHKDGEKRHVFINEKDSDLIIKGFKKERKVMYFPFNLHDYLISIRYIDDT